MDNFIWVYGHAADEEFRSTHRDYRLVAWPYSINDEVKYGYYVKEQGKL